MKLWELRSYEQVIKLEQERLVYQARLRSRFGRPLAETAPSGLAAAGIEPALLPPAPVQVTAPATVAAAPTGPEHRELESSPAPEGQFRPQKEAVEEGTHRPSSW
jgi:hypothetical protein